MSTAEAVGYVLPLNFLIDHSFWMTFIILLAFTPVGHCLVGLLLEGRVIPLTPKKQFLSFFPGDILLGVTVAGLLVMAQDLPLVEAWYNQAWWHATILAVAAVVAFVMTVAEVRGGVYPLGAILSPTKIYHNLVLYVGYGYVAISTLVAVIFGSPSWWIVTALVPGIIWGCLVAVDSTLSGSKMKQKAAHAHVENWKVFGVFGPNR